MCITAVSPDLHEGQSAHIQVPEHPGLPDEDGRLPVPAHDGAAAVPAARGRQVRAPALAPGPSLELRSGRGVPGTSLRNSVSLNQGRLIPRSFRNSWNRTEKIDAVDNISAPLKSYLLSPNRKSVLLSAVCAYVCANIYMCMLINKMYNINTYFLLIHENNSIELRHGFFFYY